MSKNTVIADSFGQFVNNVSGYTDGPFSSLNQGSWRAKYDNGGWLYRAAVDRIANEAFRRGYVWQGEDDQITRIEAVQEKHNIVNKKKQALQLARLDGDAYLYLDDGRDVSKGLTVEGAGDLRFVNVLQYNQVSEGPVNTDPVSEFFGRPEYYQLGTAKVHPSRVLRISNNVNPATGKGSSVLKIIDEILTAAICSRKHIVDLLGEARIDVMKVKNLHDMMQDPLERRAMEERYQSMAQLKASLAVLVMDMDGEDYAQKNAQFANLDKILEAIRREVSAALEIPHAVLFGREQGLGTNGETDLVTYYDTVAAVQSNIVTPAFALLDTLTIKTALGKVCPNCYIEWLPLRQPSEKEIQETGNMIVDRHKKLIESDFPKDVAEEMTVNALTEAGVAPGLLNSWNDYLSTADGDDVIPEDAL